MLGYLLYVVVGWILLALPASQQSVSVSSLDMLLTAVSAVSTTGLAVVDTAGAYSFFGELVVLLLIQLGGLGYMTLGSFVVLSRSHRLGGMREKIGRTVFSLPEGFRLSDFLRAVVVYSFVIEAIGAAALWLAFRHAGVDAPVWQAVFHSVSAFCTAGFSLFSNSMEPFVGDPWILGVVSGLSLAGGIGFIVAVDLWRTATGRQEAMTITSRIILLSTGLLVGVGTVMLLVSDASLRALAPAERVLAAVFQSVSASTTVGFNSVPIGSLALPAIVVVLVLMLIGASPSGTGGGLKTTTATAMVSQASAALRGRTRVTFWRRQIPPERLFAATAACTCYGVTLGVGLFMLTLVESASFEDLLFEATSALGTVGLSRGITPDLSTLGKLLVIVLMFAGRVGPLTVGMAMFTQRRRPEDADLAI